MTPLPQLPRVTASYRSAVTQLILVQPKLFLDQCVQLPRTKTGQAYFKEELFFFFATRFLKYPLYFRGNAVTILKISPKSLLKLDFFSYRLRYRCGNCGNARNIRHLKLKTPPPVSEERGPTRKQRRFYERA